MSAHFRFICVLTAPFALALPAFAADAISLQGADAAETAAPVSVVVDVRKGDQWVYEFRDELTDELKMTNSIVISEIAGDEIDTRLRTKNVSTLAESWSLVAFDRFWRRKEDPAWNHTPYQENWGIPNAIRVRRRAPARPGSDDRTQRMPSPCVAP